VQNEHFDELIDAGLRAEVSRALCQKPWVEGHATLTDLLKAGRYLMHLFGCSRSLGDGSQQTDRHTFFPQEVFREFQRLVKTLVREDRIFISDRKLVKLYKLLRVRAWLLSGGTVSRDDFKLLTYLGETHEEMALLRQKVPALLGHA
jgi:MoxR-like ATPase